MKLSNRVIHKRLAKSRGKASMHNCVDCKEKAKDWSFDRKIGNSLNFKRYKPRCRSCHRKKDAKGNANSLGFKHSKEFKEKASKRMKKKKYKDIIASSNKRRTGWKHTKEWLKENIKRRDKLGRFKKKL